MLRRGPHTWSVSRMRSSTVVHEWSPWPISHFGFCVVFEDTTYTEVCGLRNHKKFLMHARRATIHTISMRLPPGNVHEHPVPTKWSVTYQIKYLIYSPWSSCYCTSRISETQEITSNTWRVGDTHRSLCTNS